MSEELEAVDEVAASLEAGVADAEGIVDEGLVTVEVAFAAVLRHACQYDLMIAPKEA